MRARLCQLLPSGAPGPCPGGHRLFHRRRAPTRARPPTPRLRLLFRPGLLDDHGPPPDRRSPNACPPQSSQYSSPRHGSPMRVATRPTRGPAGGRTTGVTPRPRGSSRFDRNARPDSALRRFMPQLGLAFLPPLASPISRDQRRNQPDPEPARSRRPPHRPPHHRPSAPRNRATPRTARIRPIASNRLNTARNRHVTRGIHRGGRFTARVRLTS